jgi:hypothetical protein
MTGSKKQMFGVNEQVSARQLCRRTVTWGLPAVNLSHLLAARSGNASRILSWRYVRHFIRVGDCTVCDRNRIGGLAPDESLATVFIIGRATHRTGPRRMAGRGRGGDAVARRAAGQPSFQPLLVVVGRIVKIEKPLGVYCGAIAIGDCSARFTRHQVPSGSKLVIPKAISGVRQPRSFS